MVTERNNEMISHPSMIAPEGLYTFHETINVDPGGWTNLSAADREVPINLTVFTYVQPKCKPTSGSHSHVSFQVQTDDACAISAREDEISFSQSGEIKGIESTSKDTKLGRSLPREFINESNAVPIAREVMLSYGERSTQGHFKNVPMSKSAPTSISSSTSRLSHLFSTSGKRSRSKTMMTKSNSTFVSKLTTLEALPNALKGGTYATAKELVVIVGETPFPSLTQSSSKVTAPFMAGSGIINSSRNGSQTAPSPSGGTAKSSKEEPFTKSKNMEKETGRTKDKDQSTLNRLKGSKLFFSKGNNRIGLSSAFSSPNITDLQETFCTTDDSGTLSTTGSDGKHSWLILNVGKTFFWMDEVNRNVWG
jgi:hypothetical protein